MADVSHFKRNVRFTLRSVFDVVGELNTNDPTSPRYPPTAGAKQAVFT
jgi:hypothetical protein